MVDLVEQPNECVHCGKQFTLARTLFSHMCENKRRAMQKDEKRVQVGLMAYNRFYQITQNSRKTKTYEEFCKSSYYNAFVKFGSFINNVNPLYPERFVEYVIKSGVKLDHWSRDELYEKYLYETLKTEPVESAVQRSLQTMMEWGDRSQAQYNHYFKYVNHNRAVHDIRNGKISPWVILNCKSGKNMVENFNDEQLNLIAPALDVPYWIRHFKKTPADIELVKEICREADIE
jgi:hypothetical protein